MQNIILLHGALGAASDLDTLSASLAKHGLKPYSFSFSGHSEIPFGRAFGIEGFSEELNDFILKNKLSEPVVFGYSMGGYVAMHLAGIHKHLIAKIITLGTKFNWSKETVEKETRMLDPDTVLVKVPAFAKLLEAKHGRQWKDLLIKTAQMMKEIGEKEYLNSTYLQTLELPVLLGLADRDQMVSLNETSAVFKQLPNAAMYMLPKSKHQIESVDADLLSGIIKKFIEKN